MSAMENLLPEQMFSTEDNPAHGISAVKALQIAAAEGQRIWTITSENSDIAIPNLSLPDDIISEIRNSAAAGMEITAHEQPVNFYGSSQIGYIILDPQTGAGAYKIGGGENGGAIFGFYADFFSNFGTYSEGVGRIGALGFGKFFFGLGGLISKIGGVLQVLANMLQVVESCIAAGASVWQFFGVMLSVMLMCVFTFGLVAQISFSMPGIGNFIAWFLLEVLKSTLSDIAKSIRC
jgi:hypothetical protein